MATGFYGQLLVMERWGPRTDGEERERKGEGSEEEVWEGGRSAWEGMKRNERDKGRRWWDRGGQQMPGASVGDCAHLC